MQHLQQSSAWLSCSVDEPEEVVAPEPQSTAAGRIPKLALPDPFHGLGGTSLLVEQEGFFPTQGALHSPTLKRQARTFLHASTEALKGLKRRNFLEHGDEEPPSEQGTLRSRALQRPKQARCLATTQRTERTARSGLLSTPASTHGGVESAHYAPASSWWEVASSQAEPALLDTNLHVAASSSASQAAPSPPAPKIKSPGFQLSQYEGSFAFPVKNPSTAPNLTDSGNGCWSPATPERQSAEDIAELARDSEYGATESAQHDIGSEKGAPQLIFSRAPFSPVGVATDVGHAGRAALTSDKAADASENVTPCSAKRQWDFHPGATACTARNSMLGLHATNTSQADPTTDSQSDSPSNLMSLSTDCMDFGVIPVGVLFAGQLAVKNLSKRPARVRASLRACPPPGVRLHLRQSTGHIARGINAALVVMVLGTQPATTVLGSVLVRFEAGDREQCTASVPFRADFQLEEQRAPQAGSLHRFPRHVSPARKPLLPSSMQLQLGRGQPELEAGVRQEASTPKEAACGDAGGVEQSQNTQLALIKTSLGGGTGARGTFKRRFFAVPLVASKRHSSPA